MKVLALYGSPRPGGFSSRMHDLFLNAFPPESIKRFHVASLDIKPCTACGSCRNESRCPLVDDMDMLYEAIREAGLVSISSPVYFSSLPSSLKAFIDRCQVFWEEKERGGVSLSGKRGLFMSAAGGDYRGMFTPSVTIVRHFFNSTGIVYDEGDFILLPATDMLDRIPAVIEQRIAMVAGAYLA